MFLYLICFIWSGTLSLEKKNRTKQRKKITIGQILIRLVNFNRRKLLLSLVVSGGVSREGAAWCNQPEPGGTINRLTVFFLIYTPKLKCQMWRGKTQLIIERFKTPPCDLCQDLLCYSQVYIISCLLSEFHTNLSCAVMWKRNTSQDSMQSWFSGL